MEKLSRTATILSRIVKVLRGICIGCGIACAIMLLIAIFLPDSQYHRFVSLADENLVLGNVTFHLTSAIEPTGGLRLPACFILIAAAIDLGLSAVGLTLLHKILLPMSQKRPFDSSVSANLKKLGWVTLAGALVYGVFSAIADTLAIGMYDLNQIFTPGLVTGYTVQQTSDIGLLLIPALMFLLSCVFRYGEELQAQSDETL